MRDHQFANVEIYYTDEQGFFLEDEKVQQFTQLQIAGTFTSSTSLGATIEASIEQDFARDLQAGDKLLLKTATQQHIVNVVLGFNILGLNHLYKVLLLAYLILKFKQEGASTKQNILATILFWIGTLLLTISS